MDKEFLLGRFKHYVQEARKKNPAPVPEVTEDALLDYRGLGLNSVEVLTILVKLERELELELSEDKLDTSKVRTVSDLLQCFA